MGNHSVDKIPAARDDLFPLRAKTNHSRENKSHIRMANPLGPRLRDAFRRTLKQVLTCEESSVSLYRNRCRCVGSIPWTEIAPEVQAVEVNDREVLIRAAWQFTLDPRATGQWEIAKAQITDVASRIALAVPNGATMIATFRFPPTETVAEAERIICWFHAVVRGRMPGRTAA